MNKKASNFSLIVFAMLVLMAFTAHLFFQRNEVLTQGEVCELVDKVCQFDDANSHLRINFVQRPQIETELIVRFTLDKDYEIEQAWIEGDNMYMGKIPVIFENIDNDNDKSEGITFLGSCTQAKMQWRMNIILQHKKTEHLQQYSVLFSTQT